MIMNSVGNYVGKGVKTKQVPPGPEIRDIVEIVVPQEGLLENKAGIVGLMKSPSTVYTTPPASIYLGNPAYTNTFVGTSYAEELNVYAYDWDCSFDFMLEEFAGMYNSVVSFGVSFSRMSPYQAGVWLRADKGMVLTESGRNADVFPVFPLNLFTMYNILVQNRENKLSLFIDGEHKTTLTLTRIDESGDVKGLMMGSDTTRLPDIASPMAYINNFKYSVIIPPKQ